MFQRSPNKENTSRRSMKLRKSINTSLNATNLDKENVDDFASYIDYVRSIEASNENLKNERQQILDSSTKEIDSIKTTYGNEIDSLRKALDDLANSKIKLNLENQSIKEENEILSNKLKNETCLVNALKTDTNELQENIANYRKKLESFEEIKQEYKDLCIEVNKNKIALKNEISKCVELENRIVTLTDEIQFLKKLNSNSKNVTMDANNLNYHNVRVNNIDANMNEQIEIMKSQLTEDFQQYKDELDKLYQEKCTNITKANEKYIAKYNLLFQENKNLKTANFEKDNQISALNNRVTSFTGFIEQRDREHEVHLKEIMDDNKTLQDKLESKIQELSDLVNEKIAIEKEFYMFTTMLEGEKTRCNFADATSPKRRKLNKADEDANFDIIAYTNDKMKLFIDDQYDGDYIKLFNDTDNIININEWKLEIVSDGLTSLFIFPDRAVNGKKTLQIWANDAPVMDDENNIRMNVALPDLSKFSSCKLTNDMDGFEASFELKRIEPRKILKVKPRNGQTEEKCAIM